MDSRFVGGRFARIADLTHQTVIMEYLEGTSIADLAKALGEKRRQRTRRRRRGSQKT